MAQSLEDWIDEAPHLECDWEPLKATYRRSLVDLAALRFSPLIAGGRSLPAAGLPWFMTMFGRDSIFTSLQALPFAPELAATTLRVLGEWQGTRIDDFRDEDPGRILHEMRYGEMAAFEERPHSPYYGAVDATPLYVILLDEYERWTGDRALVRDLEDEARAAINWIDQYADLMGNGYISYKRRNERTGLENQSWKDSWNSISYADGRLPELPAGDLRAAGLRLRREDPRRPVWRASSGRTRHTRSGSRRRPPTSSAASTATSGLPIGGYYALALDADGSQVDSLASNNGLLLWSGIVDANKAKSVVGHLMGPRMWSGWGVRTLAEGEGRYNPVGYHLGTVWPFDNSFIAWGMRRYGFKEEAARIASGILDAAEVFDGRLPEAFGGYDRDVTRYPVKYPTACSPQAWSTGAPLLLLRTMLGLEPLGDHLVVDPALPSTIGHLELLDIPGRWGRLDAFGRGRVHVHADKRPASVRSAAGGEDGTRRRDVHREGTEEKWRLRKDGPTTRVVIVGGGFAGVACAASLAKHDDIHVTLIDKNDYHQFQPLLYQVATSMLGAGDIAFPLRKIAAEFDGFEAHRREVASIDPKAKSVTTVSGDTFSGDYLVLAAGSQPNFFKTPGAEHAFPLYSLDDAQALRTRIIEAFEEADRDAERAADGALDFVIVGGGPDGRRGGRRAVRDDQHDDGPRVSVAGPTGEGPPGRSRPGAAQDVRRQGPCLLGRGPREGRRGPSAGHGRRRDRPGAREAVRRVDDQHPVRRVGRGSHGGPGRRFKRVAAGPRRSDRCQPGLHDRRLSRACS